jgi:hypothetical protein
MADNYISGKAGAVYISTTAYSFGKWKVTFKAGAPKITNFTTAGFQALLAGIISATISVSGPYNNGNMGFTVGNTYTFILYFDHANTISLSVPVILTSIDSDDDVEGSPHITLTGESTGTFTAAIV